jgi:succinate-semialdehyde dehydrogenase/glutarate-semialdehyde dehydrogenase
MPIEAVNPATGERISSHPETNPAEVRQLLERAHTAFLDWRETTIGERARFLNSAAAILRRERDRFALLMAQEMGKPVIQGRAEIEKCAGNCEFYAQHAAEFLAPRSIATEASRSYVLFQPLGVVLAVMPWNFPFWQVVRAAAPALMAGNGMVLKHASNIPGSALAVEAVFREAGLPEGLFRTVLVGSPRVKELIEHPAITAITLTGSTPAGRAVAAQAGACLKKTVLELGGSDPYLVLDDADLEQAAAVCATSRLINGGQSCIAAKRFIVAESVARQFEELFIARLQEQVMGDPSLPETTLGPMARTDLRDELHQQVERSGKQGARLVCGGIVPAGKGAFYPPTVLTGMKKGMAAWDEETFGPVAAIHTAADEGEAIRLANDSVFGLGAAVFSSDAARGGRVASQLEAGCCFVNDFVRSDPRLPFGGVKQSGYGRELSSFGIHEFVNVKTVWVK